MGQSRFPITLFVVSISGSTEANKNIAANNNGRLGIEY